MAADERRVDYLRGNERDARIPGTRLAVLPERLGCFRICRVERLDRELGERHVERGAQRGDRAEEGQLASGAAKPQRQDDIGGARELERLATGTRRS